MKRLYFWQDGGVDDEVQWLEPDDYANLGVGVLDDEHEHLLETCRDAERVASDARRALHAACRWQVPATDEERAAYERLQDKATQAAQEELGEP